MKKAIPYLSLFSVLILAFGLDYGVNLIKISGAKTFKLRPVFWGTAAAHLILGLALVTLAWLFFGKQIGDQASAITYAVIGLGTTLYPVLAVSVPSLVLPLWATGPCTDSAAAFTAALGLTVLFRKPVGEQQ
jgi:fatty acid desaturase